MPLLSILRALFALVSLVVLALAVYLLWTWYAGDLVPDADGAVRRVGDDWRLWVGAVLLGWLFLGRFITPLLITNADTDPMRLERGDGQRLDSPSGARLHVETYGSASAQPIILTHGWSLDSTIWFSRSQLDRTALLMTRNPPAVSARGDLAMFRWDSHMALARTGIRVFVIGGSKDIVTKPQAGRTIAAAVPHAELLIVERVNHMGLIERADEYHHAITAFASSLPKTAPVAH